VLQLLSSSTCQPCSRLSPINFCVQYPRTTIAYSYISRYRQTKPSGIAHAKIRCQIPRASLAQVCSFTSQPDPASQPAHPTSKARVAGFLWSSPVPPSDHYHEALTSQPSRSHVIALCGDAAYAAEHAYLQCVRRRVTNPCLYPHRTGPQAHGSPVKNSP
jgi:hypothetical protein